jgi:hypothetical protein
MPNSHGFRSTAAAFRRAFDAVDLGQALEDAAQVCVRLPAIGFGGFNQAVVCALTVAPFGVSLGSQICGR